MIKAQERLELILFFNHCTYMCTVHQYNKTVTLQLSNYYKKENVRFQGMTAGT